MDNLENRLEYITNMYEKQIQGLKTGLISGIQKDIKIVLDDLDVIATRLEQQPEGEDLRQWLTYLNNYFNALKA